MKPGRYILPAIIVSQFCCTSLWFAGNGVMPELMLAFQLNPFALGNLTSAVQFGFISGTLIFAIFSIADRYSPSKVFFTCALLGALFNAATLLSFNSFLTLVTWRFATGFFLAGIYPVGMKIAADYYEKGLGKSLGFLVGALVLGTAFPHFARNSLQGMPWQYVIVTTSILAVLGGLIVLLFVADGPYRKKSQQLNLSAFFKVFKNEQFRTAAFGYFGHMWELYAFWAFVPVMLSSYSHMHTILLNIPLYSFFVIGAGSVACVVGGYISESAGEKRTARTSLLLSFACCLTVPFVFKCSLPFFLAFLIFWGMVVIADSPLFSTLVARNANNENKGTALTIVNCIGFAITILSIQLLTYLNSVLDSYFIYTVLGIGPLIGLWYLFKRETISS